jgi:hypothetical protein
MLKMKTRLAVLAGALIFTIGCGPSTKTIYGTVTVKGLPLESGSIQIAGGDGEVKVGSIVNGKYEVAGVGSGKIKVAVSSTGGSAFGPAPSAKGRPLGSGDREKKGAPAAPPPASPQVTIPPEYQDIDKSPLTHDSSKGSEFNVVIP